MTTLLRPGSLWELTEQLPSAQISDLRVEVGRNEFGDRVDC